MLLLFFYLLLVVGCVFGSDDDAADGNDGDDDDGGSPLGYFCGQYFRNILFFWTFMSVIVLVFIMCTIWILSIYMYNPSTTFVNNINKKYIVR